MNKPHKHSELIKAWADGAKIQYLENGIWADCHVNGPAWDSTTEYRIKPEPKPDEVFYVSADLDRVKGGELYSTYYKYVNDNLKLTFDGETGRLKSAEVLE